MNFFDVEACTRVILNILSRIFLSGVGTLLWHVLRVYVTVKCSGNSNGNIFLLVGVLDFDPIRNSASTCIKLACKFIAYVQYRVHTTALSRAFLSHGMSEFHATSMFSLAADTLLRVHVGTCKYAKRALSLSRGWVARSFSHTHSGLLLLLSLSKTKTVCCHFAGIGMGRKRNLTRVQHEKQEQVNEEIFRDNKSWSAAPCSVHLF